MQDFMQDTTVTPVKVEGQWEWQVAIWEVPDCTAVV